MQKKYIQQNKSGFALLLALIVSSVVLAIGVSILRISVNQINLSATARESEFAFQAAHAGVDCMWYWRAEKSAEYTNPNPTFPNPTVNCFGTTPISSATSSYGVTSGTGRTHSYTNTFQWGSPARCTAVTMFIIDAYSTTDATVQFTNNDGVGVNGLKTCEAGNICTVIVSDGYNRACNEVGTTIFSIQREITVEF